MPSLKNILALALLAATGAHAKGINCEGSGMCANAPNSGSAIANIIAELQSEKDAGNGNNFFYNEDQIVCSGSICAFYQMNGQNGNVDLTLQLAQQISDHGCKNCGSVPVSGDDVSQGELTINYVSTNCCGDDETCYCSQYALQAPPAGEPCQGCD